MRLDWENEIEAIKQGSAVATYMLPNLFVTMALLPLTVFLGTKINHSILAVVLIAITAILALLSYKKTMKLAKTGV